MRVVFDTNVIISAFLWQKNLKPIYLKIKGGEIVPCFSQATWKELRATLNYPKFAKQLEKLNITALEILDLIAKKARFTIPASKIKIISEDPSDNKFLDCALSSKAFFIVSGDKHLLKIKSFYNIPVLSPGLFLKQINAVD